MDQLSCFVRIYRQWIDSCTPNPVTQGALLRSLLNHFSQNHPSTPEETPSASAQTKKRGPDQL